MKEQHKGPHEPARPRETADTVRHAIIAELLAGPATAHDLSAAVGISERDVAGHLEHIRKTIAASTQRLTISPAVCRTCGFVFKKRDRLTRPGKCPVCRGESISAPLFAIEEAIK